MTALPPPAPTLRLTIDRQALAANWRALDRLSGTAEAGAAVKADGYGLGADIVVPTLADAGARSFFVAHWGEVAAVAEHVPARQIAVLHGVLTPAEAAYAKAIGALPVINSVFQASLWQAAGGEACHLMLDSGMNRLGIPPADLGDPAIQSLDVATFMSHLSCADEDNGVSARQLQTFTAAIPAIAAQRYSLANSAGIALGADYQFNLTRPGLALYGGVPREELASEIEPVASLQAAVIQTRNITAGESVGYNARFTADRPMRVAALSLGYADGFLRARGSNAAVQHEGRSLPVLGRVSMDMIMVDCSDTGLHEGDYCNVPVRLPQEAEATGLSQYELLTVLGQRFDRVAA